jgi:hypothetical protein
MNSEPCNRQHPGRASSTIPPAAEAADDRECLLSQAAHELPVGATGRSASARRAGFAPAESGAAPDAEGWTPMTALTDTPSQCRDREDATGVLAGLAGLEAVGEQLAGRIAVLRVECARRQAGIVVRRPAWKNLVFSGGPGTGKSRAAAAVARLYRELGLLSYGNLIEISAADLVGTTYRETGTLVEEALTRAGGALLMITDAHAWVRLPDRGQHILRCLYQQLTRSRDHQNGELAVILAGRAGPLGDLLGAAPALAARFPAVIDFPPYRARQLAMIFASLANEAGFTLTPDAASQAAAVLAQAEGDHGSGNARLAVRLLDEVIIRQARRVAVNPGPRDPAILGTITATDIPAHLPPGDQPTPDWPGQYL